MLKLQARTVITVVAVAAALLLSIEIWSLRRQISTQIAARVAADSRTLQALGWARARSATGPETVKATPDVPDPGIGVPALGTRTTGGVTFHRPITQDVEQTCAVDVPSPATATGGDGSPPPPVPTDFRTVRLEVDSQVAVRLLADGTLFAKPRLFVELLEPWQLRSEVEPRTFDFTVSDDLRRVIERGLQKPDRFTLAPRRFRDWRVGWSAGVGACGDTHGDVNLCGSVTWGVQF